MSRIGEAVTALNQAIADAVQAFYDAVDREPELGRRWVQVMDRETYTRWSNR